MHSNHNSLEIEEKKIQNLTVKNQNNERDNFYFYFISSVKWFKSEFWHAVNILFFTASSFQKKTRKIVAIQAGEVQIFMYAYIYMHT